MNKERRTSTSKTTKTTVTPRVRKSRTPAEAIQMATVEPDAIARRAYELFLEEGQRHGADLAHWLRAEQELHAMAAGSH